MKAHFFYCTGLKRLKLSFLLIFFLDDQLCYTLKQESVKLQFLNRTIKKKKYLSYWNILKLMKAQEYVHRLIPVLFNPLFHTLFHTFINMSS